MIFSTCTNNSAFPSIQTLNGTWITLVKSHKYFWLDTRLDFLYKIKGGLSNSNYMNIMQSTFMSVLDYGNILYCHATPLMPQQLNPVLHSTLHFIIVLCVTWLGGTSLQPRRKIYKVLLLKRPTYLTSLISHIY